MRLGDLLEVTQQVKTEPSQDQKAELLAREYSYSAILLEVQCWLKQIENVEAGSVMVLRKSSVMSIFQHIYWDVVQVRTFYVCIYQPWQRTWVEMTL